MSTDLNAAALAMVAQAEQDAVNAAARATQWDNIPASLRALPQWCFYTTKKFPFSVYAARNKWAPYKQPDARNPAKVNDPTTWCSWDDLRAAPANEYFVGPGFFITPEDDIVCIDLDNPTRTLPKTWWWAEATPEVQAERLSAAHQFMNRIYRWACEVGAWMETSMSGNGVHIFVRGHMPFPRYELAFGGSFYGARQFVALTGRRLPGSGRDLPLVGDALPALMVDLERRGVLRGKAERLTSALSVLGRTTELGRRLDLTDAEVVAMLLRINRHSYRFLMAGPGRKGNWSEDYLDLLGDLDKISGDPEQVKRILIESPCLENAGFTDRGRDRNERCIRRFDEELTLSRERNQPVLEERERVSAAICEARRQNGMC